MTQNRMSDEELEEIIRREIDATPGPWTWSPGKIEAPPVPGKEDLPDLVMWTDNMTTCADDTNAAAALGACGLRTEQDAPANMAFLAGARHDVPALLREAKRARKAEAALREANLQLHNEIERVRLEVGGTRRARIEWRVEHPLRAPIECGTDEERARACLAHEISIWGPEDGWRLRSRVTFVGDWRDTA